MTQSLLGGRRGHTAQSNMCAWTVSRCTAPPSPASVRTRHGASTAQVEGPCCRPGETAYCLRHRSRVSWWMEIKTGLVLGPKDRIGAPERQGPGPVKGGWLDLYQQDRGHRAQMFGQTFLDVTGRMLFQIRLTFKLDFREAEAEAVPDVGRPHPVR